MLMVENGFAMNPDPNMLAQMRARFPAPPNIKVEVELETTALVGGAFDDLYECMICNSVVWDVKDCKNCERLFCAHCINTWNKN